MLANPGADRARMVEAATPLIEIDEASFLPGRIQPVRHRLGDPPLLQTPSRLTMTHAGIATLPGCRRIATTFTGTNDPSRRARFTLVGS